VTEQIAGDALYPGDRAALVATGLYAVGPVLEEAKMVAGKIDDDWLADAADTTGAAFLGLTVGCARCHDHKYDPFSQRDYYALQAVFAAGTLFDYRPDGAELRENVFLVSARRSSRRRGSSRRASTPSCRSAGTAVARSLSTCGC